MGAIFVVADSPSQYLVINTKFGLYTIFPTSTATIRLDYRMVFKHLAALIRVNPVHVTLMSSFELSLRKLTFDLHNHREHSYQVQSILFLVQLVLCSNDIIPLRDLAIWRTHRRLHNRIFVSDSKHS
jgi:hypothetical protein